MFELETEPISSSSRRGRHRFLSIGGSIGDWGGASGLSGGAGGGERPRHRRVDSRTDSISLDPAAGGSGAGGMDSSGRGSRGTRSSRKEKRGGASASRVWPSADDEDGTNGDGEGEGGGPRPGGDAMGFPVAGGGGGGGGRSRGSGSGGRTESFDSLSEEGGGDPGDSGLDRGKFGMFGGSSFGNRVQDAFLGSRKDDHSGDGRNGYDGESLSRRGSAGSGSGSGGGTRHHRPRIRSSSGGGGGSGSGSSGGGGVRGSGFNRGSDFRRNRRPRANTMDDEDEEGEEEHEEDGDDTVLGTGGSPANRCDEWLMARGNKKKLFVRSNYGVSETTVFVLTRCAFSTDGVSCPRSK